jgi:hypothetical protein
MKCVLSLQLIHRVVQMVTMVVSVNPSSGCREPREKHGVMNNVEKNGVTLFFQAF